MKRLALVTLLSLGLSSVSIAWAQPPLVISPQDRISIEARGARLSDLLSALFQANPGANKVIVGTVEGVINIELNDVPWEAALRYVCEVAGLRLRKDPNGVYVIEAPPQPPAPPPAPERRLPAAPARPRPPSAPPATPRTAPKPDLPLLDLSQEVVSMFGPPTFVAEEESPWSRRSAGQVDLNALSGRVITRNRGAGVYYARGLPLFNAFRPRYYGIPYLFYRRF